MPHVKPLPRLLGTATPEPFEVIDGRRTGCLVGNCERTPDPDAPMDVCRHHLQIAFVYMLAVLQETGTIAPTADVPLPKPKKPYTEREGIIYFAKVGSEIKIGWTQNLHRRMTEIRPSEIMLAVPGTLAQELALHKRFRPMCVRGHEWYSAHPDLLAFISAAQSAA